MSERTAEPLHTPEPDETPAGPPPLAGSRSSVYRIAVWMAATLLTLGFLAFGSLGAVWYRYNAFTQRVSRQVEDRGIVEIWDNWLNDLPQGEGEWLLGTVFVGSIVVVLAAVVWGAWLLLVSSGDLHPRRVGTRRQ